MRKDDIFSGGLYYQANGWFRYASDVGEMVKWHTITENGTIGPSNCLLRSFQCAVEREATKEEYEKYQASILEIKEKDKNEFNWIKDVIELASEATLKGASIESLIAALKEKGVSVEITGVKINASNQIH